MGVVIRDFGYESIVITQTDQDGLLPQFKNPHNFVFCGPEQMVSSSEQIIGNANFKAPEVISGDTFNKKADVWAFGILIHFMLSTKLPNSEKLQEGEYPDLADFSVSCRDLLDLIFVQDISVRISIDEMLKHHWFKKLYTHTKKIKKSATLNFSCKPDLN